MSEFNEQFCECCTGSIVTAWHQYQAYVSAVQMVQIHLCAAEDSLSECLKQFYEQTSERRWRKINDFMQIVHK